MTATAKSLLLQLACSAVLLFIFAGLGIVLPAAVLVGVVGTVIYIYLYRCMQEDKGRRFFLIDYLEYTLLPLLQ